jgi:hypothetical protein
MNFNNLIKTNNHQLIKIVEKMSPSKFVILHQESFKDYYLAKPYILDKIDEELMFENLYDFGLWDTILEKYREYFLELYLENGPEAVLEWFGNEALKVEHIEYQLGINENLDDEIAKESYDFFTELTDYWSNWGPAHFIQQIIAIYLEMDEEELREINLDLILN